MPEVEMMSNSALIDFSSLMSNDSRRSYVQHFTVSGCGRFVLVSQDCMIYVYRLVNNSVRGITSILCPRCVVAVSMDTSSQRYAVAALLDGRMGLVCDIQNTVTGSSGADSPKSRKKITFTNVEGVDSTHPPQRPRYHRSLKQRRSSYAGTRLFRRRTLSDSLDLAPSSSALESSSAVGTYVTKSSPTADSGLPVETGQRSIYRNLCSAEDPPRSVAICPQRRCVAFGCRLGIELHWVDALSGQDLNRWFPLAAPSDYLFFLPPRQGIDNAKKLRLISSAAGAVVSPGNSGTNRRWHVYGHRSQSMTRLFFGNLPFPTGFGSPNNPDVPPLPQDHGLLRTVDCDHFRAVPLSDGTHMLFTDPEMGCLCMGSDAPLGGPTKLLRKVICIPPPIDHALVRTRSDTEMPIAARMQRSPIAYSAASELRWGLRIVATYSPDQIVLFSVPPDLLEKLKDPAGLETGLRMAHSDLMMDAFIEYEENPENAAINGVGPNEREGARTPVPKRSARIHGAHIGRMEDVVDLAVDASSGDLKVWAFSKTGEAKCWKVCTEPRCERSVWKTTIKVDGSVVFVGQVDEDGDVKMCDPEESATSLGVLSGMEDDEAAGMNLAEEQDEPSPMTEAQHPEPGPTRADVRSAKVRSVSFVDGAQSPDVHGNGIRRAMAATDHEVLTWPLDVVGLDKVKMVHKSCLVVSSEPRIKKRKRVRQTSSVTTGTESEEAWAVEIV